jgi:hypothetical protein
LLLEALRFSISESGLFDREAAAAISLQWPFGWDISLSIAKISFSVSFAFAILPGLRPMKVVHCSTLQALANDESVFP